MRNLVLSAAVAMAVGFSISPARPAEARASERSALDCSKPHSDSEHYICDSPYLRSLLRLVDDDTGRLMDLNPMSRTLKAEYDIWIASQIQRGENSDLRNALAVRHRKTERALDATRTVLAARHVSEDIHKRCVELAPPLFETLLLTCKVEAVNGIASGLIGQRQVWTGPAEQDQALWPMTAMAILETAEAPAPPETQVYRVVGWVGADAATIGEPLLVEGDGKAYLTIPKTENGSASPSSDVVMVRFGPAATWREIDATSWSIDLDHRLPRGLYPKLAYSLDLLTMRAITDIARDNDPACCPSGGQAEVGLALKDGVLVIDSLVLRRPAQQQKR
jgi:hypothetical protein